MFHKEFIAFNREDNFTREGREALYSYFTETDEEAEEEIELDVIAICCEYTEYDSFKELQGDYSDIKSRKELEERTYVIPVEGTNRLIIQQF